MMHAEQRQSTASAQVRSTEMVFLAPDNLGKMPDVVPRPDIRDEGGGGYKIPTAAI
jgi:hypothetical protein